MATVTAPRNVAQPREITRERPSRSLTRPAPSPPSSLNSREGRRRRRRDRRRRLPRPGLRARRGAPPSASTVAIIFSPRRAERDRKGTNRRVFPPARAPSALPLTTRTPHLAKPHQDLFAIFDSIDKAADKVEEAFGVVAQGVEKAGEVVEKVTPVVKPLAERAVEAATPVVKAGADYAGRAAGPIVQTPPPRCPPWPAPAPSTPRATPSRLAASTRARRGRRRQSRVRRRRRRGLSVLPSVDDVTGFFSTASPTELAEAGAGAVALYLLSPALLGAFGGVLRGYAGSVRPVEAYDAVTSGKCVIVDIRQDTGRGEIKVPRGKVLSIPREKLSGNFKNMGDVEANLTALKVASLKGVKRGTKVLILDNNGGSDATKVAKALAAQGFGKAFVAQGGSGWLGERATTPSSAQGDDESYNFAAQRRMRVKSVASAGDGRRRRPNLEGATDALPITLVHDYQYHRSSARLSINSHESSSNPTRFPPRLLQPSTALSLLRRTHPLTQWIPTWLRRTTASLSSSAPASDSSRTRALARGERISRPRVPNAGRNVWKGRRLPGKHPPRTVSMRPSLTPNAFLVVVGDRRGRRNSPASRATGPSRRRRCTRRAPARGSRVGFQEGDVLVPRELGAGGEGGVADLVHDGSARRRRGTAARLPARPRHFGCPVAHSRTARTRRAVPRRQRRERLGALGRGGDRCADAPPRSSCSRGCAATGSTRRGLHRSRRPARAGSERRRPPERVRRRVKRRRPRRW